MFLLLIQDGYLELVHLEFMVSGHSMMPCDRTFGVLEKKFKKRETIDTPEEYREVINATNHSTAIQLCQKILWTSSIFSGIYSLERLRKSCSPSLGESF